MSVPADFETVLASYKEHACAPLARLATSAYTPATWASVVNGLRQEANASYRAGNYSKAFIQSYRLAHLVLVHLMEKPELKSPTSSLAHELEARGLSRPTIHRIAKEALDMSAASKDMLLKMHAATAASRRDLSRPTHSSSSALMPAPASSSRTLPKNDAPTSSTRSLYTAPVATTPLTSTAPLVVRGAYPPSLRADAAASPSAPASATSYPSAVTGHTGSSSRALTATLPPTSAYPSASSASSAYIVAGDAMSHTPATSYAQLRALLSMPLDVASPLIRSPRSAAAVSGLRRIRLPGKLIRQFAEIASPNTALPPRGIETCAILAGVEDDDGLRVSHLVVPKQRGNEDQCEMLAEEELVQFCLDNGLLSLGWIHTHPSQSCFMSSMDQHTHSGYQAMLAEAVAVVVAPRDADTPSAVFRLTDETDGGTGLQLILDCSLSGFHPHTSDTPIYGNAVHAALDELPLQITDLRAAR